MSTAKRNPPFRAEHCGSLLRPQELVQKRYDVAAGKCPTSELEPLEDKTITDVVKLQKDAGFHIISSGEYARCAPFSIIMKLEANLAPTGTCSGELSSKNSMA